MDCGRLSKLQDCLRVCIGMKHSETNLHIYLFLCLFLYVYLNEGMTFCIHVYCVYPVCVYMYIHFSLSLLEEGVRASIVVGEQKTAFIDDCNSNTTCPSFSVIFLLFFVKHFDDRIKRMSGKRSSYPYSITQTIKENYGSILIMSQRCTGSFFPQRPCGILKFHYLCSREGRVV